ncbi:MAG: hypothetical protein HKN32_10415, partial [Flavobacteriales bacterium]|nr:hypothetical protein [Flavobacteriales bacterium]
MWRSLFCAWLICTSWISLCAQNSSETTWPIDAEWVLYSDTTGILQASVPGCVHTALLDSGIIPDPFIGNNEQMVSWVSDQNWTYTSSRFDVSAEQLQHSNVLLRFRGLDTYANVWLNDEHILAANNFFRTWEVDVKDVLKPSDNQLRISLRSPLTTGKILVSQADHPLPGEAIRAVTRKPQ